jgi:hypothetical protein
VSEYLHDRPREFVSYHMRGRHPHSRNRAELSKHRGRGACFVCWLVAGALQSRASRVLGGRLAAGTLHHRAAARGPPVLPGRGVLPRRRPAGAGRCGGAALGGGVPQVPLALLPRLPAHGGQVVPGHGALRRGQAAAGALEEVRGGCRRLPSPVLGAKGRLSGRAAS